MILSFIDRQNAFYAIHTLIKLGNKLIFVKLLINLIKIYCLAIACYKLGLAEKVL
jgi:hypothetical protein